MMREYKIGEIFGCEGKVFQCVKDFIEVEELKEGMLFRAENGKLYRLATELKDGEKCSCQTSGYNCSTILRQLCTLCPPPLRDRIPREWPNARFVLEDEGGEPDVPPVRRHIEIAVDAVEGENVRFHIVEQTHRESEFSLNNEGLLTIRFQGKNGVKLASYFFPQYREEDSVMFVRGADKEKDDLPIEVTFEQFARIMETITEYNLTNGHGYEKPWPKKGDFYYSVEADGIIRKTLFVDENFDNNRRKFGNFFRTREAAEAALERVKKALLAADAE